MNRRILNLAALTLMAGTLSFTTPVSSYAAPETEATGQASTDDGAVIVEEKPAEATAETTGDDAAAETKKEVEAALVSGELEEQGPAVVYEALEAAKEAAEAEENSIDAKRQYLVNYAKQFIGGKYRAGGNDPNTGADCSGFVKYVMQNGAGITMNRSSSTQINQGVPVSADQMQPGDLIFYSNGSRVNHVAMYIGNGQIVHASTYSTGIKISQWNYRTPVRIMNVLG